ncbi:MAG: four helix bundle protein [Ignavibacteriaceae bacterium]|nr:four helix bundle protein [Ignavibacteriaceae bacterium]
MNSIIKGKSFNFALRIIRMYKYLTEIKKEYILSRQLLKSGTSIGANVEEALGGQSDKDFISKISIAYKEARETDYWIKLLKASGTINTDEYNSIIKDCREIQKILSSILITTKKKLKKDPPTNINS